MKKTTAFLLAALLALSLCAPALSEGTGGDARFIRIAVKDYGNMYAALYPDIAPVTVENFLALVNRQFYDGLTFHRIISGFMIQGGDPRGNGTGGSEQRIKGEFSENGVDNPLKHERGVISMARSQDMDSASSQFFIMHQTKPHLDGRYAAFGRVLSGLWIVDRICQVTQTQNANGAVARENQPVIESIREATREEAEAAAAAEAANGRAGSVFSDPLSPVSFPVPAGWNRTDDQAGRAAFTREAGAGRLLFLRFDQWAGMSEAARQQLTAQQITRKDLNTAAYKKEALAGLAGLAADLFSEETRSGVRFYTAEQKTESVARTWWIGAKDGFIYLFVLEGGRSDPSHADLEEILNALTFR